jgi:hypothetical protein
MPEFPTWNGRSKLFFLPPLPVPALSFLSSGETDQKEGTPSSTKWLLMVVKWLLIDVVPMTR